MATPRAQRYAASFAAFSVFVLVTVTLGFACATTTKPAAGLEVIFSTMTLRTPQDFDRLLITVSQESGHGVFGSPLYDFTRTVPNEVTLPTSLSIAAGSSPDQLARIVVRALKGTTVVVERIAEVQIPTSSLLELDIDLASDCLNMLCRGTADTTCIGGVCQNVTVIPPSQLRPYQPTDMGGASSGGDATVGGVDAGVPMDDGATAACVTACVLMGGCVNPGGTPCCIQKGVPCPFGGGMCNGGVCGAVGGDSGGTGGSCAPSMQAMCTASGSCWGQMGSSCVCVAQGAPCPGGGGMCRAGGVCGPGPACTPGSTCVPPGGGQGVCDATGLCVHSTTCQGCPGCCDGTGACQAGTSPTACGTAGAPCTQCPSGAPCNGGGCGSPPPCGMTGQACCTGGGTAGGCNPQATCSNGTCVACGQSAGQSCCGTNSPPLYCMGANLFCSGTTCVACGALNQPCCNGGCSGTGLTCNGTTCVPQCGLTGNACCPYNQCSQGCCENGTCTGQGSTCSVYGGTCANQGCQGNTCGSNGQACCTAPDGGLGCTNGFNVCKGGTCQMCGMPGAGSYSNCCPGDVCQSAGSIICTHAADAGSGGNPDAGYCVFCGGYRAPCCNADAGPPPGNMPCQTGYSCTAGICQ